MCAILCVTHCGGCCAHNVSVTFAHQIYVCGLAVRYYNLLSWFKVQETARASMTHIVVARAITARTESPTHTSLAWRITPLIKRLAHINPPYNPGERVNLLTLNTMQARAAKVAASRAGISPL